MHRDPIGPRRLARAAGFGLAAAPGHAPRGVGLTSVGQGTLCPVLIGREPESALLAEALRAAQRSEGRVLMVAGDAGIGKTRLTGDFARVAASAGLPVLAGGCTELDGRVPYLPFVEAIRNELRQRAPAQARAELDSLFAPPTKPADPSRRQAEIFEGVLRFLEDLAGAAGLVLILEDLHWSDSASRDLLDYLARSVARSRILVIGTYRADELDRSHPLLALIRGWLRRGSATSIELEPLSAAGVDAMLDATIGAHNVELAARLHQRSEGNPFVLEEMLKTGWSEGHADQPLPATVRDAILRRVERLPPDHMQVLRVASVLGDPIDDSILVDLLGADVPDAIEACARQQFLTLGPDGTYAWRHALTRDAVYEDMAPTRRRQIHAALADLYEERPGLDDVALGRHLAAAGRWDAAVPRFRRTAAEAIAVGAFADGARLLELCLPHLDAGAERAEVLEELAELLMQSGDPRRGEVFAREALALQERRSPSDGSASARRTLAVCLWQQARWAEAIDLEQRSIAELDSNGASPMLVSALARRASWSALAEADLSGAVTLIARAKRVAAEHGFDAGLYRADEGQVLVLAGRFDEGFAIMDEAWRGRLAPSGDRGSDWREARFMLHHAAALRNLVGLTNESLAILAESPISSAAQDAAETSLTVVRVEALWAHGEVVAAQRLASSLDLSRIETNVLPWAQSVRADLLFSSGQPAAAAALARTAMPPHWQPVSQLRVAGLVRLLVAGGDVAAALELARRLDALDGYGIECRLPFIDAVVEAHLAARPALDARAFAAQAREARGDHPLRLRVEARMLMAEGSDGEALAPLRRSIEGFERTGHRQDEWRTRRLLAQALRTLGRRAEARAELRRVDDELALANGAATAAGSRLEDTLSAREREVALLVARGLKNREIAEQLVISERTVENHIHRALERTGFRSRAELAARITLLSGELSGSPE